MLPSEPNLILAKKSIPPNNLQELIAWLKANADEATGGTSGSAGLRMSPASCFKSKRECIFSSSLTAAPVRRSRT